MKNWIVKKAIPLLLSAALVMGMNGFPACAAEFGEQADGNLENRADDVYFTVTIGQETKSYKNAEDLVDVWQDVQGKTAVIHLKKNLDISNLKFKDEKNNNDNLHTLFLNSGNITLEMDDGVKLSDENSNGLQVIRIFGGVFTFKSGEISSKNTYALTVEGGSVYIEKGATLIGNPGLYVNNYENINVKISGGIFQGKEKAVECAEGLSIRDILANGYAFQDQGNNWQTQMDQTTLGPGPFTAVEYPMKFSTHPAPGSVTYGGDLPVLYAEAEKTDEGAVKGDIEYKWHQITEEGADSVIAGIQSGEGSECRLPDTLGAGTYQYYCRASCDWFSLNSEIAAVTIKPKTLTAQIQGSGDKDYDGTTEVPPGMALRLDGVVGADCVSASALSWAFDSPKAGRRTITASDITISGKDAGNYVLASNSASVSAAIRSVFTGVSLDRKQLQMQAGSMQQLNAHILPENTVYKDLLWESGDPGTASVDSRGMVTAVKAGTAMITVTTEDGSCSDSCIVTVTSAGGNPGSGAGSSSDSGTAVVIREPFIKGWPDKKGWNRICMEAEQAGTAPEGGTIAIDMNGTGSVPGRFFAAVKDKDVTVFFDMGGGFIWKLYGKDITAEMVENTDISIRINEGWIPRDVINNTAGGRGYLELAFGYDGALGFPAVLTVDIDGNENNLIAGSRPADRYAGMYANLYGYNSVLRRLEWVCTEQVTEDGTVSLPFTHTSDAVIVLSVYPLDGSDTPEDPSVPQEEQDPKPEEPQKPAENTFGEVTSVELSKSVYTYNGKEKKPAVTAVDADGRQIPDTYYTVRYKNNRKAGRAAVSVTFQNGYSGTVEKTFTIRPAGTSVKKLQAAPGGFTVIWAKKTAQTSGYQIQYSIDSGFQETGARRVLVKKASVTQKAVKKLKGGKNYYVRIRTYKTIKEDGKDTRIYSSWSRAAKVKTLSKE